MYELGVTMKPIKERIKIYLWVLVCGLFGIFGLLLTGYNYTRARGFHLSEKREAMSVVDALQTLPKEYIWFFIAFIIVVCIVELFIFIVMHIKNK